MPVINRPEVEDGWIMGFTTTRDMIPFSVDIFGNGFMERVTALSGSERVPVNGEGTADTSEGQMAAYSLGAVVDVESKIVLIKCYTSSIMSCMALFIY